MKIYVRKPIKKWAVQWTGRTEKQDRNFCKRHRFQYVCMYNTTLCFSTFLYKNNLVNRLSWILLSDDAPVIDRIFTAAELFDNKNSSYTLNILSNKEFNKDYGRPHLLYKNIFINSEPKE